MGTRNSGLWVITTSMTHEDLMGTVRWQQIRWFVYEREGGKCRICGRPGMDTHHLSYKYGFFNPQHIILVCRPCHLIWQGEDPDHLSPDHSLRPKLFEIAAIARSLGRTPDSFEQKVSQPPLPEWVIPMIASTRQVMADGVKRLLAAQAEQNAAE